MFWYMSGKSIFLALCMALQYCSCSFLCLPIRCCSSSCFQLMKWVVDNYFSLTVSWMFMSSCLTKLDLHLLLQKELILACWVPACCALLNAEFLFYPITSHLLQATISQEAFRQPAPSPAKKCFALSSGKYSGFGGGVLPSPTSSWRWNSSGGGYWSIAGTRVGCGACFSISFSGECAGSDLPSSGSNLGEYSAVRKGFCLIDGPPFRQRTGSDGRIIVSFPPIFSEFCCGCRWPARRWKGVGASAWGCGGVYFFMGWVRETSLIILLIHNEFFGILVILQFDYQLQRRGAMSEIKEDGFQLIWLYWLRRYMQDSPLLATGLLTNQILEDGGEQNKISFLQNHYTIEAVELDQQCSLQERVAHLKQHVTSPNKQFYLIHPEQEAKIIQDFLSSEEQLIGELHSYYLNSQTLFLIRTMPDPIKINHHEQRNIPEDNVSEGDHFPLKHIVRDNRTENYSKNQLTNSLILNKIIHSNEQDSFGGRNDSLPANCDQLEHQIEGVQMASLAAEWESVELWNCKYKRIPHTFYKTKHSCWSKCLSLPLMHPCQPKTIGRFPILPRLTPLRPSQDNLLPFVSYIKLLDKYFPTFNPSLDSIFQFNGLPYVFSREDSEGGWAQEENIGLLCYLVVHGDEDGRLGAKRVEKWAEQNKSSLLGKTILEMNKRQRERNKIKKDLQSKSLLFFEGDSDGDLIW